MHQSYRSLVPILWVVLFICSSGIYGEEINPFPVPEWLLNCTRPVFARMEKDEDFVKLAEDGAQALFNLGLYIPFYDGKDIYQAVPDASGQNILTTVTPTEIETLKGKVARVHELGMRAIGTMPPMWEIKVLDEHRDWQRLGSPSAGPRDPSQGWPPPSGCYVSPFGEWYIQKNRILAETFGWDGQNIDGFGTYTVCYCPHCREAYRRDTGAEIPVEEDIKDSNYRRFLRWRLNVWGKFVHKWQKSLKELNPDFAFIPWSTGPGRWWHWAACPRVEGSELGNLMVDAPVLELFWDFPPDQGTNLLPSFTARFYRGFCEERPVWMHTYFRSQGQQQAVTPRVESEFRMLTAITNGVIPSVAYWLTDKSTPPKHYLDLIKKREPWTKGATSIKHAALLMSENSRLFYGVTGAVLASAGPFIGSGVDSKIESHLSPGERRMPAHVEAAIGFFRALNEAHIPVDIISDRILEQEPERLAEYTVLILPDAACLSDQTMANIRRFVERGGGLVATHLSSLLDENGTSRKDFGLADLFGASFQAAENHSAVWPDYQDTCLLKFSNHPITQDPIIQGTIPVEGERVDYIGMSAHVSPKEAASSIASYVSMKDSSERPFLLLSEHGKGRVAYFAAAVDQSYFVIPYQYQRPLLVNTMRWAANKRKPLVEIEAPMCVQTTYYEQKERNRLVIHLLNETNTTADRALPESNPPMREEILPIRGARLVLHGVEPKKLTWEPDGAPLEAVTREGNTQVALPELGLHGMVVVER